MKKVDLFLFHNGDTPGVYGTAITDAFADSLVRQLANSTNSTFSAKAGSINNLQTEASNFQVSTIPTLVITIAEDGLNIPVARLIGNAITKENVIQALTRLVPLESNGDGTFEGNGLVVGGGKELSFGGLGFNLFNLNIPAWLLAATAIVGGVQSYRNRDNNSKFVWGAVAGLSGINYVKKELGA